MTIPATRRASDGPLLSTLAVILALLNLCLESGAERDAGQKQKPGRGTGHRERGAKGPVVGGTELLKHDRPQHGAAQAPNERRRHVVAEGEYEADREPDDN